MLEKALVGLEYNKSHKKSPPDRLERSYCHYAEVKLYKSIHYSLFTSQPVGLG